MDDRLQLVVFRLGDQRYAVPLAAAVRIVRVVEVTPLPGAPAIVRGAIDVAGLVVPVIDLRRRFLLPERDIVAADHLVLADAAGRRVALLVDDAEGVVARDRSSLTGADDIAPGLDRFHGVVRLDDGLVLIHDLEALLSLDEARALEAALIPDT